MSGGDVLGGRGGGQPRRRHRGCAAARGRRQDLGACQVHGPQLLRALGGLPCLRFGRRPPRLGAPGGPRVPAQRDGRMGAQRLGAPGAGERRVVQRARRRLRGPQHQLRGRRPAAHRPGRGQRRGDRDPGAGEVGGVPDEDGRRVPLPEARLRNLRCRARCQPAATRLATREDVTTITTINDLRALRNVSRLLALLVELIVPLIGWGVLLLIPIVVRRGRSRRRHRRRRPQPRHHLLERRGGLQLVPHGDEHPLGIGKRGLQ
mmetsp:Transcript_102937/g.288510  ORF Transcript_102937/g.288510 Transcript_102937/m.288510 type:complete len:262 (+) Transcript_102937:453-1238(+)